MGGGRVVLAGVGSESSGEGGSGKEGGGLVSRVDFLQLMLGGVGRGRYMRSVWSDSRAWDCTSDAFCSLISFFFLFSTLLLYGALVLVLYDRT